MAFDPHTLNELWKPSASIETLRQRSVIIKSIRSFFEERGYLEVETSSWSRYAVTDVYLSQFQVKFQGKPYFLQTSPEYHMKRLLAAGSGPIFQLARAFRDDELGRWHNPEFTLLEWYQLSIDHHALMDEVELFLQSILHTPPLLRKSYQQCFIDECGINPFEVNVDELKRVLQHFNLDNVLSSTEQNIDQYLFLLMSHVIEPNLPSETPVAIHSFPPSQAALANIENGRASRFEVYYGGVELANGFHELTDVKTQTARFIKDNQERIKQGLPEQPVDNLFLAALKHGLPVCSGVALGVDRMVALKLKQPSIASVMTFDQERC